MEMTRMEKIDLLRDTITYLYEKEGRSKSYISRVLVVNRQMLGQAVNEWGLVKADGRHLTPSNQKFLNRNRKTIIDMLDSDRPLTEIAQTVGKSRDSLTRTFIKNDKELLHHYNESKKRLEAAASDRRQGMMDKSSHEYDIHDLDSEEWRGILGYEGYEVSSMGRVRHYSTTYGKPYLLTPAKNSRSGRMYISLKNNNGGKKNLNFARVVGHAFVDGFSDENNTIDHIDGNVENNRADNLEWVSPSENNLRYYSRLANTGKAKNKARRKFKKIVMDEKYEFKTIEALSRFLGVSLTQTGRYLSGESKSPHTFRFVYQEDDK